MNAKLNVDIEESAAAVVGAVLSGSMSETDGRLRLAELAGQSGIVEKVVRNRRDLSATFKDDVLGAVQETVVRKIMLPEDNGYDFTLGFGSSFSGFVRNLARTATPSAVRSQVYRNVNHNVLVGNPAATLDPSSGYRGARVGVNLMDQLVVASSSRIVLGADIDKGADTHLASAEDEQWEDEVDTIVRGASHMFRQAEHRPHYAAALTLRVTGTPSAVRPMSVTKRQALQKTLAGKKGPELAVQSLRAYLTDDEDAAPAGLVDLWADYTPEDARILLCREEQMVHAVALAAVSRLPLPNTATRTELARKLASKAPDNADFVALVPDLVRSLLAVECFHVAPSSNLDRRGGQLTDDDENSWRGRVAEVANLEGCPLGSTITEVMNVLRDELMATMPTLTYEGLLTAAVDKLARRATKSAAI